MAVQLSLPIMLDGGLYDRIVKIANLIHHDNESSSFVAGDPPIYSLETIPRSLANFHFTTRRTDSKRQRSDRQAIPWFCYISDPGTPSPNIVCQIMLIFDDSSRAGEWRGTREGKVCS